MQMVPARPRLGLRVRSGSLGRGGGVHAGCWVRHLGSIALYSVKDDAQQLALEG